jgi:hypothetical protein
MQLQIENTNVCNARCVFCCYGKMDRPKGFMSMDLFRKIIDDAADIPLIDKVTITGMGEPLLDKDLMERLSYIQKKMKIGCLDLYTNGSKLTIPMIKQFIKIPVNMLYVSLNGTDRQSRKEMTGLDDYDEVVAVLDEAIRIADGTALKIIVKSVVGSGLMEPSAVEIFGKRWGGAYNGGSGHSFVHIEGNWAGKLFPIRVTPKNFCGRAYDQIMVLQDGRVPLCCFDAFGEVILGDLKTQTIQEIYNGGEALRYRTAHATNNRSTLKLCKDCTTI